MRFVTMCTLAFAICGKANRQTVAPVFNATTEDFEHRVGIEINLEDHLSTTKTVPSTPMRKASSTGSSIQVRRLAKILLAASASRGVQSAWVRAPQQEENIAFGHPALQDGNIELGHAALDVLVDGILGPTSWEKYESALAGLDADLEGWQVKDKASHHKEDLRQGRGVYPEENNALGHPALQDGNIELGHAALDHPVGRMFLTSWEKYELDLAGLEADLQDWQKKAKAKASQHKKNLRPGWAWKDRLVRRVFALPSMIQLMAGHVRDIKNWQREASMIKSQKTRWKAEFHQDKPHIAEMERNLNIDWMKAIDIMRDS